MQERYRIFKLSEGIPLNPIPNGHTERTNENFNIPTSSCDYSNFV